MESRFTTKHHKSHERAKARAI